MCGGGGVRVQSGTSKKQSMKIVLSCLIIKYFSAFHLVNLLRANAVNVTV